MCCEVLFGRVERFAYLKIEDFRVKGLKGSKEILNCKNFGSFCRKFELRDLIWQHVDEIVGRSLYNESCFMVDSENV